MCASIHKNVPIFGDDKNEGYCCKKERTSPANASFNKNVHVELLEVKMVLTESYAQFFRDDI